MIKIMGAVSKQDQEQIMKTVRSSIPNIIAAVLIFLIPTFVDIVARLSFPNSDYSKCISGISKEKVEIAYDEKMSELVSIAEESLKYSDYSVALGYLQNIKDSTKREHYTERLDEIKEAIDKKEEEENPHKPVITYYEPILPPSGETIVKSETTDSLIINITKKDNYYLTRIWAIDPCNQLNKRDAEPYGSKLERPSVLLKKEMEEKGLQGQLMLGFNASGFYLKDTYDPVNVNRVPAYNKTSVGTLVITNGKVVRNFYEKGDITTWFISGIDRNNQFVVYVDKKISETNSAEKKAWSEEIINSGVRNTLTFAAPVILNGEKTNYSNKNSRMPGDNASNKGLQMMCQINDNNFVLFTSSSSNRNKAIAEFMNMGCKTAVNLDGGGSVALLFKSRSSNTFEKIVGDGRNLPEAAYFGER